MDSRFEIAQIIVRKGKAYIPSLSETPEGKSMNSGVRGQQLISFDIRPGMLHPADDGTHCTNFGLE